MNDFGIEFTDHARDQMEARCISPEQILEALKRGEQSWERRTVRVVYKSLTVVVSACWRRVVTVYDKSSELRVTLGELLKTK